MLKNNTKSTLKYYWYAASQYKWLGLSLMVSVTIAILATVVAPLYFKQFFDLLASGGDRSAVFPALLKTLSLIALVYLVEWMFWRIATFLNSLFELRTIRDLTNQCFQYLHLHSFNFFSNNFIGTLTKRVNWFTRSFESLTDRLVWDLLPLLVRIVFITVVLWGLNKWLGIGILVWSFVYMIITSRFSTYKMKYDLKRSETESKTSGYLADTLTNNSNVKLFNGYRRELQAFAELNQSLYKIRLFTWNLDSVFEAVQGFLAVILQVGIFYYALVLWRGGALTLGSFVLVQSYLMTLIGNIWNFGRVIRNLYQTLADAEEMTVMLDTPHEIRDVPTARPLSVREAKIEFIDVDFYYHETRPVLKNLNLTITPGERIALIGPSGAGKSTIAKIILRMYEISGGKIMIDGQRIDHVTQESLWRAVSLVPQDPILFHRSLMENIRYGKPDATDEEVIEAAKAAHIHDFISKLPEAYNTHVGERGIKLSGGERQRVAIARAILKNAPILVLDEATSSLDSESEHLIQEALEKLMKGKTVIAIAHRLSTIRGADRILVISDGKIIEEGTHTKLIRRKAGVYNKLWQLQAGGFMNS